jgi:hypothetical protein
MTPETIFMIKCTESCVLLGHARDAAEPDGASYGDGGLRAI